MAEDRKLPKIEFGLSARAELKAEVPSSSMGRLVDALTDAIRPFTESRGLKADQVRLQREEVLIEIAKRAHERLVSEAIKPCPVPNKFLVPFLEKASLEELESELIEIWAALLASASSKFDSKLIRYSTVLSELGPREVKMLNRICCESRQKGHVSNVPINFRDSGLEFLLQRTMNEAQYRYDNEGIAPSNDIIGKEFVDYVEETGSIILTFCIGIRADTDEAVDLDGDVEFLHPDFGLIDRADNDAIAVLESVGLVRRNVLDVGTRVFMTYIDFVHLTEFGAGFYLACNQEPLSRRAD